MLKRSLLVGINNYERYRPLRGCVNDATALRPLLAVNATADAELNFDCQLAAPEGGLTRDRLLRHVDRLFADGPDCALLYFAGHGEPVRGDVALVTSDGVPGITPGVKFQEILERINESKIAEVIVILDCCFSGGAGKVPLFGDNAHLRPGLSILTASRDDQVSVEDNQTRRGLFSTYLEAALEEGAADLLGNITLSGVYAYISEVLGAWDQRPTFKANIDRLHNLRKVKPAIPRPVLREITAWFPNATDELPLNPSYEPTADPQHDEHQRIFGKLQRLRAVHVVEPVGEEHLYFAAMNYKSCRLTELGRHYHQLVKAGRV